MTESSSRAVRQPSLRPFIGGFLSVGGFLCVGIVGVYVLVSPVFQVGSPAAPVRYVLWAVACVAMVAAVVGLVRAARRHAADLVDLAVARCHADELSVQLTHRGTELAECQRRLGQRDEQLARQGDDLAQLHQRVAEQTVAAQRLASRLDAMGQAWGFLAREAVPALVAGTLECAWPATVPAGPEVVAVYDSITAQVGELRAALEQADDALRDRDCQLAVWTEGTQFLADRQLPALAAGQPVPAVPDSVADDAIGTALRRLAATAVSVVERVQASTRDREEAIRVATVGLARTVQALSHRVQEAAMAMVAAHPTKPDVLDGGYRIDHAAAQQARYAQNLAVLCGEATGQQWQEPLAVAEIVAAAASRIVPYERVHASGDPDIAVVARVVEPLIGILAELLANGAQSSPATTEVLVAIRSVQRGVVVEIDDCGVGMEEFRLHRAREIASGRRAVHVVDLGQTPQTGLAVVGEYVRRHGLRVDLGDSVYGGVRAVVFVPDELTEVVDPATRPNRGPDPGLATRHELDVRNAGGVVPVARRPALPPAAATTPPPTDPADRVDSSATPVLPQRRSRRHARQAGDLPPVDHPPAVDPPTEASPVWPAPSPEEAGAFLTAMLTGSLDTAPGHGTTATTAITDGTGNPPSPRSPSAPLNPAKDVVE